MAEPTMGYTGIGQLKLPQQLADKRLELENARSDDVRNWSLNRAFYRGDQWIIWNRLNGQVQSLPTSDSDKPRWKVRLTSNQILPGMQHYVALLTKTRPQIHALPDSGSDKDIKAAQTAESLHEWWWRDLDLDLKLQGAMTETGISQAYWHICWDALAGKSMTFMLDPQGQPILDEEMADMFKDQLKQMGIDPEQAGLLKTVYVGDISVDVLPGENVWVDRSARTFEDATYVIIKSAMSPEDVQARYKENVLPNSQPLVGAAPLTFRADDSTSSKATVDVYCLYHKPTAALPKGRIAHWIEGPMKILEDGPWDYPTHDLPLVKFPGWERPGSALDEPLITHVRPLQKEFNRTLSQLVQFKDLTIKPQVFAPAGSLRTKLTDEPGAAFEYNPINNLKPEWRQPPQLGSEAFNILQEIQSRIDLMFNKVPTERSSLPARVDSGNTVELIQEAVADQMTPVIRRMENALAKAGKLMVALAKVYYTEPRIVKVIGPGGSVRARKFMNTDLDGGYSFHAVAGTGLPRSRAGRWAQIKEMLEMQLIDPHTALKHLDLADVRGLKDKLAADEDQALREHDKLLQGQPINPWNLQQADQAISAGMDPQTNQPLQTDPATARQMASLQPLDFEDWDTHIATHASFMKTSEFERWPPQVQMMLLQHYNATYERKMEVMRAQMTMDPKTMPTVGVTARATVSAPVMAKLLQRHGIDTDEHEVSEEPLETAIYDSVDKPDADEAANDPLSPQEIALYEESIQKQQAMQQDQQAKADAQTAKNTQTMQSIAHEADMHHQRLREAAAKADLAERTAKEKKINQPKPAAGGKR